MVYHWDDSGCRCRNDSLNLILMRLRTRLFSTLLIAIALDGIAQRYDPDFKLQVGLGIASPYLIPERPLYFYQNPDFDGAPFQFKPIDSVTFFKGEHYVEIKTAPPWFAPESVKLDYDILNMRVITYSQNWIEVVVNNHTGQTAWIDRHAAVYSEWSTFLAQVVAVEVIDVKTNPIRIKPIDHTSILAQVPGAQLRPLAIKGEWLLVSTVGLADRIVPTGWVRWKKGDQLLILYSILS